MKLKFQKLIATSLSAAFFLTACNPDEDFLDPTNDLSSQNRIANSESIIDVNQSDLLARLSLNPNIEGLVIDEFPIDLASAVEPSECAPTAFNDVISQSVSSNIDQLGQDFYDLYTTINQLYTFIDEDPQYFGANGEYNNFIKQRVKNLEKFWDMKGEITVRGQHNSTLNDRDKIALVYINFAGLSEEDAYANADDLLAINEASTFLPESPLMSFDGFATSGDLIVIGDGLVELASAAGVEDKVVWSGIMAHEWAHQIQFDHFSLWYPNGAADNEPEATRTTELEADFIAAYYLTHKKGATYNWKRVEDFFELFFNIGDCSFTSPGHHGTPVQRLRAAEAGFQLAQDTFPKGHVLDVNEVHEIFLNQLDGIVSGDSL
ncbi:hypothetical protein [Xanthovirga aplysinae]|uniref:hypothetical protein n=1 Tax=Xanthovirga aplysinae TaxID=2529853 RepID=UPI0012BC2418|nr:hypothetical protein [Xanthovirga aplysinae]MTI29559.1 hypothetical protein [Xanthovirga aplysinae]